MHPGGSRLISANTSAAICDIGSFIPVLGDPIARGTPGAPSVLGSATGEYAIGGGGGRFVTDPGHGGGDHTATVTPRLGRGSRSRPGRRPRAGRRRPPSTRRRRLPWARSRDPSA